MFNLLINVNACLIARLSNDPSVAMPFINEMQKLGREFFGIPKPDEKKIDELEEKLRQVRDHKIVVTPRGIEIKKIDEGD